jgi:hypothetical protein
VGEVQEKPEMERRTEMRRFLTPIVAVAMFLFIAGPAMAQWTVDKSYTYDKDSTVTATKDIDVDKKVDITVSGELPAEGKIDVQGDVVFKELDVEVQDEEVVNKFFELDDSASSRWTVDGLNPMNVMEQIQNGEFNFAFMDQVSSRGRDPRGSPDNMNVGLQYQIGNNNDTSLIQSTAGWPELTVDTNNFAKQIQFGEDNFASTIQNNPIRAPGG